MWLHPDEIEEQGYAERCDETLRQILREEHHDPYMYERDEPTAEELEAQDRERAELEEFSVFEEHEEIPF